MEWSRFLPEVARGFVFCVESHAFFDAQLTLAMRHCGCKGQAAATAAAGNAAVRRRLKSGRISTLRFGAKDWRALWSYIVLANSKGARRASWMHNVLSIYNQVPHALVRALMIGSHWSMAACFPNATDAPDYDSRRLLYGVLPVADYADWAPHNRTATASATVEHVPPPRRRTTVLRGAVVAGSESSSDGEQGVLSGDTELVRSYARSVFSASEAYIDNLSVLLMAYAAEHAYDVGASALDTYMRARVRLQALRRSKRVPANALDAEPLVRRMWAVLSGDERFWRNDVERQHAHQTLGVLSKKNFRRTLQTYHYDNHSSRVRGRFAHIHRRVPLRHVLVAVAEHGWRAPIVPVDEDGWLCYALARRQVSALDVHMTLRTYTETARVRPDTPGIVLVDADYTYVVMHERDVHSIQQYFVPHLCTYPLNFVRMHPVPIYPVHVANYLTYDLHRVKSACTALVRQFTSSVFNVAAEVQTMIAHSSRFHRVFHRIMCAKYVGTWDATDAACRRAMWHELTEIYAAPGVSGGLSVAAVQRIGGIVFDDVSHKHAAFRGGVQNTYTGIYAFLCPHNSYSVMNSTVSFVMSMVIGMPYNVGALLPLTTAVFHSLRQFRDATRESTSIADATRKMYEHDSQCSDINDRYLLAHEYDALEEAMHYDPYNERLVVAVYALVTIDQTAPQAMRDLVSDELMLHIFYGVQVRPYNLAVASATRTWGRLQNGQKRRVAYPKDRKGKNSQNAFYLAPHTRRRANAERARGDLNRWYSEEARLEPVDAASAPTVATLRLLFEMLEHLSYYPVAPTAGTAEAVRTRDASDTSTGRSRRRIRTLGTGTRKDIAVSSRRRGRPRKLDRTTQTRATAHRDPPAPLLLPSATDSTVAGSVPIEWDAETGRIVHQDAVFPILYAPWRCTADSVSTRMSLVVDEEHSSVSPLSVCHQDLLLAVLHYPVMTANTTAGQKRRQID